MAMLRTRRLAQGRINPSGEEPFQLPNRAISQPVYLVPAGTRAIVRDVRLASSEVVAGNTTLLYIYQSGVVTIVWTGEITGTGPGSIGVTCDVCLEPGDTLAIDSTLVQLDWYVSGAELLIPGAGV